MKAAYGQNFLTNRDVAERIIGYLAPGPEDAVVEIGPGKGILTEMIAGRVKNFTVIEIDPVYHNLVRNKVKNIDSVNQDALKFDYAGLRSRLGSPLKLVSNLPYEISSPIMNVFVSQKSAFSELVLMFQKEFGDRLCAREGDSSRGALSVIAGINFYIQRLFNAPREDFNPVPKVDSTVLRLIPRQDSEMNEDLRWASGSKFFDYFVHQVFKLRRKKLKNSIHGMFMGIPPDVKEKIFVSEAGVDLNKRPQELKTDELIIAGKKYDEYLSSRENVKDGDE